MTNAVILTQPQTFVVQTSNQWSTGICDCCEDMSSCECLHGCVFACWYKHWTRQSGLLLHLLYMYNFKTQKFSVGCFGFWCFWCFACKTTNDLGECLCLPLLDLFGIIPPITISMRATMRQRYGIQGSICNDCVNSFFCGPCVWCQMSREKKIRGGNIINAGL
uniref:Plac8 onzin related protein 2 n=1 Tax=Denticeps clupeoides TaxID=299321 RepID=A0AAY4BNA9_9TELE